MTLDLSWQGAHGCVRLFLNPEIRLRNVPADDASMSLTLRQGAREMGGQNVSVPVIASCCLGTIRTFGPCNPGLYEWTEIFDRTSFFRKHQGRFYPAGELASGQ
jgi:hypothetical protein